MTLPLPNLVVIGAMKCGTTALHRYLGRHPAIDMSREKELNFFSRDERWARGVDWYAGRFDAAVAVRGETSPSYTDRGKFPEAAERMAAVVPEARLIYLVRDPVHRIVADYSHRVSAGEEARSWSEFVGCVESTDHFDRSRYFWQLQPYLKRFSPHRILVLAQRRLRDERSETLRQVFRFLGVDDSFWSSSFGSLIHETRRRRTRNAAGRALGKVADPLLKRLPGDQRYRIGRLLYLPVSRPVEIPRVDGAARRRILSLLEEDIVRLECFLGPDSDGGREARAWLSFERHR